jgi:hypothetical protein
MTNKRGNWTLLISLAAIVLVIAGIYFLSNSKVYLSEGAVGSGSGPKACNSPAQCKTCEETCFNGKCTKTGKVLCSDLTCVSDSNECYCNPKCKNCVEKCDFILKPAKCVPNPLGIICPDGRCEVDISYCSTCNCENKCNDCLDGKCAPSGKDLLCEDGVTCVQYPYECPGQKCGALSDSPICSPCTEYCAVNECKSTGKILCDDGRCIPRGSDCSKKPPVPK